MDGGGKTAKQLATIGILEAIGTAILITAINFSAGNAVVVVNGVLTGAVLSGKLTGAHFNMAVSLGVFIADGNSKKKKANIPLFLVLVFSQLIGALLGQWISYFELGIDRIAVLGPASLTYSAWHVFAIEALSTFIFVTALLHNVFPRLSIQSDTVLAVASVCVSLYFGISIAGEYTGAALNTTLSIVNILFVSVVTKDSSIVRYLPAYVFGTLLGGFLAGLVCKYLVMPSVPHYYDNLLEMYREDIHTKIL
jgi:glycerol uptake facilitator-like aquaporin